MELFVANKLFSKFDDQALKSPVACNQRRRISDYRLTDKWGTFSPSCQERPSSKGNPFARDLFQLRDHFLRHCRLDQFQSVYTTGDMWQTMISKGVDVSNAIHKGNSEEPAGMKAIRQTMCCIERLVQHENTKLEPFQLETLRACICSSAVRLLGEDLNKHIPSILEVTGISEREGFETSGKSCEQHEEINDMFQFYARRFVAVIAPRRNGKSKAGKLFVAANAISEPGARIVLVAHQLNAVMLYKSEILKHLHQMLDMGLAIYKVHTTANEIRIEFFDRPPSHIYFVAGGINVSIMC